MSERHLPFWPVGVPRQAAIPDVGLFENLARSASRAPEAEAIHYYGARITFAALHGECERLAGVLQHWLDVVPGEPVLMQLQNSPQFVIAYYGILRAGAVVVPVNPMLTARELGLLAGDTGARILLCAQDNADKAEALIDEGRLERALISAYTDYAPDQPSVRVPPIVSAPRAPERHSRMPLWSDMLSDAPAPRATAPARPDDLGVIVYTSGSTGQPRGCMHTHRTVQANIAAYRLWNQLEPQTAVLGALPFFHVTGMQVAMNMPIAAGARTVVLTRWDAGAALELTRLERISHWRLITAMLIDLMALPNLTREAIESLRLIGGGGAAMPEAVAAKIESLTGLRYVEGYGLSETMAACHINPPDRPKRQCLGIPFIGTVSKVVDPETLRELGPGEVGEILVSGPQVFQGYWRKPAATAGAFVEIDGKRFLRTGDLGYADAEGYFFFVDRLKRMINVAGYKVWPAEIEAILHSHPAIRRACVIGAESSRQGEMVKAFLELNAPEKDGIDAEVLRGWCAERMARYKVPGDFVVVEALPQLASGKIDWRCLQDEERQRSSSGG
ncbi:MAG: long-chain-fatty-acid--CoA ligase [Hyphomicrobiaceae bacterium]